MYRILRRYVYPKIINFRTIEAAHKHKSFNFHTSTKILNVHNNNVDLILSDSAVKQIRNIQKRDNNPDQALRIVIESGGCHGFKLLFDLSEEVEKDDILIEREGAKVVFNKAFLPLIVGSKLDFTEELIGSTFKLVNNPNAASGCGCGISFELK